ncbi:hypothetical protein HDU93_004798, partial [Gonapodya sp. JEL0774]
MSVTAPSISYSDSFASSASLTVGQHRTPLGERTQVGENNDNREVSRQLFDASTTGTHENDYEREGFDSFESVNSGDRSLSEIAVGTVPPNYLPNHVIGGFGPQRVSRKQLVDSANTSELAPSTEDVSNSVLEPVEPERSVSPFAPISGAVKTSNSLLALQNTSDIRRRSDAFVVPLEVTRKQPTSENSGMISESLPSSRSRKSHQSSRSRSDISGVEQSVARKDSIRNGVQLVGSKGTPPAASILQVIPTEIAATGRALSSLSHSLKSVSTPAVSKIPESPIFQSSSDIPHQNAPQTGISDTSHSSSSNLNGKLGSGKPRSSHRSFGFQGKDTKSNDTDSRTRLSNGPNSQHEATT